MPVRRDRDAVQLAQVPDKRPFPNPSLKTFWKSFPSLECYCPRYWTMARIRSTSSHRGRRALSPWLQSAGQLEGQRRGRLAEVELVAAEAVEVPGQVGARASQGFRGDRGA